MSLLFNMLSGLVIAFLSRSKQLLISWLQSPSAVNLEPPKIKPVTISIVSPSIFMKWRGWMPWSSSFECWALSQLFHSLSLSSSSSLLSSKKVVSSAYLRLLIFLLATLILAGTSANLASHTDKTWSTGEGHDKPIQHSCLENPMNNMKRQKDMAWKMNSPGR